MNRKSTVLLIAIPSSLILGVWLGAWYVGTQLAPFKEFTTQPLADVFSSINALFAGFAFCGVILTVYLQIKELQDTREVLSETAKANSTSAAYAKEAAIVELFKTYCSEYFQNVKNSSMNILIPAMSSHDYFHFLISRFYVAEQTELPQESWERISLVSRYKTIDDFKVGEQNDRYKLDELINFFTILAYQKDASEVIARCDFSYSWWRPMFWMIAIAQQQRYETRPLVKKYGTAPYFKNVLVKLDNIYSQEAILCPEDLVKLIKDHPKLLNHYKLDERHLESKQWDIDNYL